MSNLPVPVALLKTEVSAQWDTDNVAAPNFIEVNVSAQSLRYIAIYSLLKMFRGLLYYTHFY